MRIFSIKILMQCYGIRETKQQSKSSSFTHLLQRDFKEVKKSLYLTERKGKAGQLETNHISIHLS